jgi:hypothetical protein
MSGPGFKANRNPPSLSPPSMPSHARPELLALGCHFGVRTYVFFSALHLILTLSARSTKREPRRTSTHDENALEDSTTMGRALRRDSS